MAAAKLIARLEPVTGRLIRALHGPYGSCQGQQRADQSHQSQQSHQS